MTDERSPDLTQALLLELRAQLEEARRERDEARIANAKSCVQYAELVGRMSRTEATLADARASAEQGVKVAEALAAEKAALVARVGVLSAALRGLVEAAQVMAESHAEFHDNVILLETVDDPMDAAIIAARAALEVEP